MVRTALDNLRDQGERVFVTAQNLIEFWNSATRPIDRNGFGLTPTQAEQEVDRLPMRTPPVRAAL